MRVALAQMNPVLGDFAKNAIKILEFSKRASEKRADLVVFSELALFGYPPNDLLEREDLVRQQVAQIKKIISQIPKNICVIFGAVIPNPQIKKGGKPFQNVAVVAERGKKPRFIAKQLLPSYDIFDETRFFEPGTEAGVFRLGRHGMIAVSVCEDMWCDLKDNGHKIYNVDPFKGLKKISLAVNISASPFSTRNLSGRLKEARTLGKKLKCPFVYVNQVGGQDELIFDGRSFILDEKGKVIVQAPACEEDLVIIDLTSRRSEHRPADESEIETLRKTLVMGLRDFVFKTGQKDVHLGLSGGIDSAVVAALAVDALGPSHVTGLLLPGPYSSSGSVDDSLKLASNLRMKTHKVSIEELYRCAQTSAAIFGPADGISVSPQVSPDVSMMDQNLQARLRGLILMAYSNAKASMLLSTSNKCELACGYSTLYGDTCGGLMPIGDLVKGQIYALAEHYNSSHEVIPEEILMKAPSAELAPNQVDQDTLPPYAELDKAVIRIVEEKRMPQNKVEKWLVQQLARSEFKRWQAPPILRISSHAFGRGRRVPIAFFTA